ncbi:hypothetical protein ACWPSR_003580 [Cronobacter turicensis]
MKEPVTLTQRKKNMPVSCGKMISEADIQRLEKTYRLRYPIKMSAETFTG